MMKVGKSSAQDAHKRPDQIFDPLSVPHLDLALTSACVAKYYTGNTQLQLIRSNLEVI